MSRQYGAPPEDKSQPLKAGMSSPEPAPKEKDPYPPADEVASFHRNADTDGSETSMHHTLGSSNYQASPGDHTHDGGSSQMIIRDMAITGSQSNPQSMWPSIIAILVRLGAKDSTTP